MYLLGPFYQWLVQLFDGRVNHLPLVRLFIFSVDHAIVLFGGWLIVWSIYLSSRRKGEIVWKWELYRNLFIFYIILLAQLTIFRNTDETFTVKVVTHPISDIMWVPFVDSIKLFMQGSPFAAYYNVVGNIVWFMPLGFFCGLLYGKEKGHSYAIWYGFWTSFTIEFFQFIFYTGVSHIDDIICNVLGSWMGFLLYRGIMKWRGK